MTATAEQTNAAQKAMDVLARSARDAVEPMPARSEAYVYPDGSTRVGVPPFPALSPVEEQAAIARGERPAPMVVPPGMPRSGEQGSNDLAIVSQTVAEAEFAAQQQATADFLSGKDPHTPNPTTSSDKPILAGTGNVIGADGLEAAALTPTAEDLERIAAKIKPDVEGASDEQLEGAAVQILRESPGLPVGDKPAAKTAKASKTAATK